MKNLERKERIFNFICDIQNNCKNGYVLSGDVFNKTKTNEKGVVSKRLLSTEYGISNNFKQCQFFYLDWIKTKDGSKNKRRKNPYIKWCGPEPSMEMVEDLLKIEHKNEKELFGDREEEVAESVVEKEKISSSDFIRNVHQIVNEIENILPHINIRSGTPEKYLELMKIFSTNSYFEFVSLQKLQEMVIENPKTKKKEVGNVKEYLKYKFGSKIDSIFTPLILVELGYQEINDENKYKWVGALPTLEDAIYVTKHIAKRAKLYKEKRFKKGKIITLHEKEITFNDVENSLDEVKSKNNTSLNDYDSEIAELKSDISELRANFDDMKNMIHKIFNIGNQTNDLSSQIINKISNNE